MTEPRGFPAVPSDSRVEIVKVKLRTRNRKVPSVPLITDHRKDEPDPFSSEVLAATCPLTPSQLKPPDRESQDQFDFAADFNGNLPCETNLQRDRSVSSMRDSVSFSGLPRVASSTSNLSLVKPDNIPVERFPQEEDFVDIAVAEVVTPSKLYVNMGKLEPNPFTDHFVENSLIILASSYDKLNLMMDEIDSFYEKLLREEGISKKSSKWEKMRESITVGEYVAVMWIDQMWYRARVRNFVNHTEMRVFYIDYGTTRVVRYDRIEGSCKINLCLIFRLDQMYPLDARFFYLPAQAIEVSLAGIEPPCDDKDTVVWTKEATKYEIQINTF